jgi:protein ImuB
LSKAQGMLGPEALLVGHRQGGRSPVEQVRFTTWAGVERVPSMPDDRPWPGRLPSPAPAVVYTKPQRVELIAEGNCPVSVTSLGALSAALARLSIDGGPWADIAAWAGPWPTWERWWKPSRRKVARLQVVTAAGLAHLLSAHSGSWWLSATYD